MPASSKPNPVKSIQACGMRVVTIKAGRACKKKEVLAGFEADYNARAMMDTVNLTHNFLIAMPGMVDLYL